MTYFRFKSISILNFMKNKVSVNALHSGSKVYSLNESIFIIQIKQKKRIPPAELPLLKGSDVMLC